MKAETAEPVSLVLEDGSSYSGFSLGAMYPIGGEVVFNTGLTGYVEMLTDPSYCGQIIVLTYPIVGNYGVPASHVDAGIDTAFESELPPFFGHLAC